MNLVLEFRKLVFVQVLLGIVAFCMAARSPELLLLAGALTALSWYVVEGPTGRPLPQWCIMLGALGAMGWLITNMFRQEISNPIVPLGHFTMWLQILMLYGRKTNREYGEIMVLSMMQMIGASAMSVTLMYGVVLAVYCLVALFAVLRFHLKITNDTVNEANRAAAPRPDRVPLPRPVLGANHQWHFRGMALGVGAASAGIAVLVFLSMPRDDSASKNPSLITPPRVGWSSRIVYDGNNNTVEDNQPVMYLYVKDAKPSNGPMPSYLLRGAALTQYEDRSRTWSRITGSVVRDMQVDLPAGGRALAETDSSANLIEVNIQLVPQTERVLFTLLPPVFFKCEGIKSILFSPEDQQIINNAGNDQPLEYYLRVARPSPEGLYAKYLEMATSFKSSSSIEFPMGPSLGRGSGLGGVSSTPETPDADTSSKARNSTLFKRKSTTQPAEETPANTGKGAELFGVRSKKKAPEKTKDKPPADNGIPAAPEPDANVENPNELDIVRPSLRENQRTQVMIAGEPAFTLAADVPSKATDSLLQATKGGTAPKAAFPPPPDFTRYWNVEVDRVRALAASILKPHNIVRDPKIPFDDRDPKIALIFADYLRDPKNFTYVTDEPAVDKGKDPIIEFLFNRKRGHCELFAGGLAAMLRSQGIASRLVTGYLASEYNQLGKYYVIRQSHAHAWVEVYGGPAGWVSVDATPSQAVSEEMGTQKRHWWTVLKESWGYVEKLWIFRVVFKGAGAGVGDGRFNAAPTPEVPGKNWLDKVISAVKDYTDKWEFDAVIITALVFVGIATVIAIISMIRVAVVRKRRMVALQLTNLPSRDRKAMVKKLKFYLEMLDMLERYGFYRPSWQSPFGFAKELVNANPGKFDSVLILTEIFYEIRFGNRQLDDVRKGKIKAELKKLETTLLTYKRVKATAAKTAAAPAGKPA